MTTTMIMLSLLGCSLFDGKPDLFYSESVNVILIIGDGMGSVHEQVAREVLGGPLEWDSFPIKGQVTTNSMNQYVATDSAAAATAMSTGFKTRNAYVGMSPDGVMYEHIMVFAQTLNKRTGIVTTDEIYEATPAGFSAYSESRDSSDEIVLSQLNSGINLFIGGDTSKVVENNKRALGKAGYKLVSDLENVRRRDMFLYSVYPSIDAPENKKDQSSEFLPLVRFALNFLSRNNPEGFIVVIEGEKMDTLSHAHNPKFVYEILDLNEVVKEVVRWTNDFPNTLIIVLADHETGGLGIRENENEPDVLKRLTWSTYGHTSNLVNYYMMDPRNQTHLAIIDNTDVHAIMKDFMMTHKP